MQHRPRHTAGSNILWTISQCKKRRAGHETIGLCPFSRPGFTPMTNHSSGWISARIRQFLCGFRPGWLSCQQNPGSITACSIQSIRLLKLICMDDSWTMRCSESVWEEVRQGNHPPAVSLSTMGCYSRNGCSVRFNADHQVLDHSGWLIIIRQNIWFHNPRSIAYIPANVCRGERKSC